MLSGIIMMECGLYLWQERRRSEGGIEGAGIKMEGAMIAWRDALPFLNKHLALTGRIHYS
jgi:hypothetical protein